MTNHLDVELRRLANAIVNEAPQLPPLPVSGSVSTPPEAPPAPGRAPRRVLVGVLAIAVLVGLIVLAIVLVDDASTEHSRVPPADNSSRLEGSWRELPTTTPGWTLKTSFPFAIDDDTLLTINTESNFGSGVAGEIYRFSDGTVRAIAPSDLEWRANAAVVWTGSEVIVAGGSNGPGIEHAAAAYNPATDTWRTLPEPPGHDTFQSSVGGPAVWSGTEMIAWRSGLAFNPTTDLWRALPTAPLKPRTRETVVAIPNGVFVWGGCDTTVLLVSCDDVQVPNGTELADGAVFDIEHNSWTVLPSSPLVAGNNPSAVWTGDEVVVLVNVVPTGDHVVAAAYNPSTEQWRALPTPPHLGENYGVSVWTGKYVLTHSSQGGIVTALDPQTSVWFTLPPGPERDRQSATLVNNQLVIVGGYPSATPWAFQFSN
jgi:hypothetical protein